jgi:hypothetical protein
MKKVKTKFDKCKHKNAYFLDDNASMYYPDCKKYIDDGKIIRNF